jgi:hypothetical protein
MMNTKVPFDKAKMIIQAWYKEYCRETGAEEATLEIKEIDDKVSNAYRVTNSGNGKSTPFFWSYVSDYESLGAMGIPGDLKTGIWETFHDITQPFATSLTG